MRISFGSTSMRTFVVLPAAVAAERALRRRRPHSAAVLVAAPVLATGYGLYRWCGQYRLRRAGGPAGFSQGRPDELVTTGPYALTRNPMYLGHLVFMSGLTLGTGSPVAAAALAGHLPWFAARVRRDEQRLTELFGGQYDAYLVDVPRWIPYARRVNGLTFRRLVGRHGAEASRCSGPRSTSS